MVTWFDLRVVRTRGWCRSCVRRLTSPSGWRKTMARSLRKMMSTLVVQKRHVWLNLVEMKDVDKARFLDAPISQAGQFGDTVEGFAQAVLGSAEPEHLAPWCTTSHHYPAGQASVFRVHPPASSRAAPPQAESTPRPACWASCSSGQPGDVAICSFSGDGEDSVAPSHEGGLGGESSVSFCFCSRASGTHIIKEIAISFSSGFSSSWADSVWDALPPHSRPWPFFPAAKRLWLGDTMPLHA